jgi:hypothetical protein
MELATTRDNQDRLYSSENSRRVEPDIIKTVQVFEQNDTASKTSLIPLVKTQHPWLTS